MKQEVNVTVSMNIKSMYLFLLQHTYTGFSGIVGLGISILALLTLYTTFDARSDTEKLILLIIGLVFTVINPIMLLSRAAKQVKLSPSYKTPLSYCFNSQGITVSQEEQTMEVAWNRIVKIKSMKFALLIYTSRIHAFILPHSEILNVRSDMEEIVLHYADSKKTKLIGFGKGRRA